MRSDAADTTIAIQARAGECDAAFVSIAATQGRRAVDGPNRRRGILADTIPPAVADQMQRAGHITSRRTAPSSRRGPALFFREQSRSIYFCTGTLSLGGVTPGVTTFPVSAGGGLISGGLGAGGTDGGVTGGALAGPVTGLPRVGPPGRLPKVGPAAGELRDCAFAGPATATSAAASMAYLMKQPPP
jgi:hypothetical protein